MLHGPSIFDRLDANHDGKISRDEVQQVFARIDADGDDSITKGEMRKSIQAAIGDRRKAGPAEKRVRSADPSAVRGRSGMKRPPFGRGMMGRGPMSGGPIEPGPSDGAGRQGPPSPSFLLERFDNNKDGKLSKSELPEFIWNRLSKADSNSDGEISRDEIEKQMKSIRPDGTSKPQEPAPKDKNKDKPVSAEVQETKPKE